MLRTDCLSPFVNIWVFVCIKKVKLSATCHGGTWGERRYSSYSYLNPALHGGEWSASRPGHALPRYPLDRGWVGPRAGLYAGSWRKILCLCRGSNPGRPVHSQTLYWLRYPGLSRLYVSVVLVIIILGFRFLKLAFRMHWKDQRSVWDSWIANWPSWCNKILLFNYHFILSIFNKSSSIRSLQ
jgi:hypothetical protein